MAGARDVAARDSPDRRGLRVLRDLRLIHLIYLVTPFFQPAFTPEAAGWHWALAIGLAVAGAASYLAGMVWPNRARLLTTVPMTVLGLLATPFNSGAGVMFVYAAGSAAAAETRRVALRWFVGLTVLATVLTVFSSVPMPWRLWGLIPPVLFIWIIGATGIDENERQREAEELRLRNARVEHLATLAERERIARDLHDLLGHSLTAVVVRAQLVRELIAVDPERARTAAAEIEDAARDALSEVRGTVTGWRQSTVDAELRAAEGTLDSVGVALTVHRDPDLRVVGSTEHELARALREVLTNVVRHAGARTCTVTVVASEQELSLTVADDGVGYRGAGGNGLTGVRERIAVLGGTVEIQGRTGTTVRMAVPLEVAT